MILSKQSKKLDIIENDTDFRRESSPGFRFQCPCLIFEDPEYFVEYSIEHHSLWHWSE